MNQKIKELADEAGFMDSWFSESGDDCERELKKFAELIIRECTRACTEDTLDARVRICTHENLDHRDSIEVQCANRILKRFGIEQ